MADLNALIAQGAQFNMPDQLGQYAKMQQLQAGQQQMRTGALQEQTAGMQLQKLQEDRANMAALSQKLSVKGVTPRQYFEALQTSGDPQHQQMGIEGLMKLDATEKYDKFLQSQQPIPAQQPPAMSGALGSGTFGMGQPAGMPAPANALAPQAAAPMAATNALAPTPAAADPVAALETKIAQLRSFNDPRAQAEAVRLQKQVDEYNKVHVVGTNLVTGAGLKRYTGEAAPTDVKKLLMERDALPPGSPNRALYDQQIKDLGATAQAARDRLAFDQQKFKWEKDNPGHELIQNADGEYFAVNKRNNQMTPLMIGGGAAPAAAAPAGGGRGSVGVTDGGRAAPTAGVPFVGKTAGMTESQSNAALFGSGMAQAQNVLTQASKKGVDTAPVTTSIVQGIVKYVPFGVGDKLVQDVMSVAQQDPTKLFGPDVEQQKVGQAQLAFTIAYLRKTSGAAFGQSELVNTMNEFFPSVGEDKAVTTQKAKARERVVEGMKLGAGSQGAKFIKQYQGEDTGGVAPSANDPLGLRK